MLKVLLVIACDLQVFKIELCNYEFEFIKIKSISCYIAKRNNKSKSKTLIFLILSQGLIQNNILIARFNSKICKNNILIYAPYLEVKGYNLSM